MVSRLRMKLDLLVQSTLMVLLALAIPLEPLHVGLKITLIVLVLLQMLSAAQLWLWHTYRPAKAYLWAFFLVGLLLPVGLYFFNPAAWLFLLALAIVYFVHTIRIAAVVLRRPRSFWDIS